MREFLVRIATDLVIQRLVWRPVVLVSEDGRVIDVFYKVVILCDACGERVNAGGEGEETLPTGYALCDEERIIEVVCEGCRKRYFWRLPVYDSLEEAERG